MRGNQRSKGKSQRRMKSKSLETLRIRYQEKSP